MGATEEQHTGAATRSADPSDITNHENVSSPINPVEPSITTEVENPGHNRSDAARKGPTSVDIRQTTPGTDALTRPADPLELLNWERDLASTNPAGSDVAAKTEKPDNNRPDTSKRRPAPIDDQTTPDRPSPDPTTGTPRTPKGSSIAPASTTSSTSKRPADPKDLLSDQSEPLSASPTRLTPKKIKRSRLPARSPEQELERARLRALNMDFFDLHYKLRLADSSATLHIDEAEKQAVQEEKARRDDTMEGFGVDRAEPTSEEQKQRDTDQMLPNMSTRWLQIHLEYIGKGSGAYNAYQREAIAKEFDSRPAVERVLDDIVDSDDEEGEASRL